MTAEELQEFEEKARQEALIAVTVEAYALGIDKFSDHIFKALVTGIDAGIYGMMKALQERQLL
jgi:hypothetical protein